MQKCWNIFLDPRGNDSRERQHKAGVYRTVSLMERGREMDIYRSLQLACIGYETLAVDLKGSVMMRR